MIKSFSQSTKDSLSRMLPKSKCCRKALLYGCLAFSSRTLDGGVLIENQSEAILKMYSRLLNEFLGLPKINVDLQSFVLLNRTQLGTFIDNTNADIDEGFFECENCRKYFICGVFLNRGSLVDPEKGYRLELVFDDKWNMTQMSEFLSSMSLSALSTKRSGKFVLYYKNSETIGDFLNCIGAQKAAFDIMNILIEKELRNNANRIVNCDSHNIERATNTGRQQANAIKYLCDTGKIGNLPDELRITAMLRYNNPELPLTELAQLHEPIISKSGLNHRLRKICEKAKEEQEKDNK